MNINNNIFNMLDTRKIHFLVKSKVLTQKRFSEKIGISPNTYISLMKSGDFRLKQVYRIAKVLDVDFFDLFKKGEEVKKITGDGNSVNINSNNNNKNNNNNRQTQLKKEIEYLKEKCTLLESKVQDKEELIELLKK